MSLSSKPLHNSGDIHLQHSVLYVEYGQEQNDGGIVLHFAECYPAEV